MRQTTLALNERRCAWCNAWFVQSCRENFVCSTKCALAFWTWEWEHHDPEGAALSMSKRVGPKQSAVDTE